MSTAVRMNVFLQRMIKRNDEELNAEAGSKDVSQHEEIRSFPKSGWIRKLGNSSPGKHSNPSTPVRPNSLKNLGIARRTSYSRGLSAADVIQPEMPDLESIIQEFETGFLSPTKHSFDLDTSKQGNFVKKIVAAFEVKYKAYNDYRAEEEAKLEETERVREIQIDSPKKGIFNPFKTTFDEGRTERKSLSPRAPINVKNPQRNCDDSTDSKVPEDSKRKSGMFSSPFKLPSEDTKAEKKPEGSHEDSKPSTPSNAKPAERNETRRKLAMFSSPFGKSNQESKTASTEVTPNSCFRHRRNLSITKFSDIFADSPNERSPENISFHDLNTSVENFGIPEENLDKTVDVETTDSSDLYNSPFKSSDDDTKSIVSVDLSLTLPESPCSVSSEDIHAVEYCEIRRVKSKSEIPPPVPATPPPKNQDKTPKIVGAYLKKPIEVEDTAIDWIPITGKKLPRKKSLKKLFSVLTGKKSGEKKANAVYASAKKTEEPREFQDSGYDEKSCSSTSLSSLASIAEVLQQQQQENGFASDLERRSSLRTFQSKNSLNRSDEEDDVIYQTISEAVNSGSNKKLILTEVPREKLTVDLGPSYPSAVTIPAVTMSLDRRSIARAKTFDGATQLDRLPKHPFLSKIPKHPFVSMTKLDESDTEQEIIASACEAPAVMVTNDIYAEVMPRRDRKKFLWSPATSNSSSSSDIKYDVPRKYLSKSESEIDELYTSLKVKKNGVPPYDVPKGCNDGRPRSSVYEDALSLKRRTAGFMTSAPDFYSTVESHEEPHYATVKPRNRRICFSEEMLKSFSDLRSIDSSRFF